MKVSSLIKHLKKLDPNARVVLDGYEGGLDDIERPRAIRINENVFNQWYYGPHETADKGQRGRSAVYLERKP